MAEDNGDPDINSGVSGVFGGKNAVETPPSAAPKPKTTLQRNTTDIGSELGEVEFFEEDLEVSTRVTESDSDGEVESKSIGYRDAIAKADANANAMDKDNHTPGVTITPCTVPSTTNATNNAATSSNSTPAHPVIDSDIDTTATATPNAAVATPKPKAQDAMLTRTAKRMFAYWGTPFRSAFRNLMRRSKDQA